MSKISRLKQMTYDQLATIWDNYWEFEAALSSSLSIPFYVQAVGDEMDYRIRNYDRVEA